MYITMTDSIVRKIIVTELSQVFLEGMRQKFLEDLCVNNRSYLLYCPELEGMNTILYVTNNDVYVYRIAEMQKHKLRHYMKNRTAIVDS